MINWLQWQPHVQYCIVYCSHSRVVPPASGGRSLVLQAAHTVLFCIIRHKTHRRQETVEDARSNIVGVRCATYVERDESQETLSPTCDVCTWIILRAT